MKLPKNHPAANRKNVAREGILLVNLGTPDGTDYFSMRRYLKEFLSDSRVVEVNRVLWWFILNVIILTVRPAKSGRAYAKIWNRAKNESPLRTITRSQAEKVQKILGKKVKVDWAMRYGQPALAERLDAMVREGVTRVKVVPLYPQYAGATVGSVGDAVARWMLERRYVPAVEMVAPYYDEPVYVQAIAKSIKDFIRQLGWTPEVVLASFHGLPVSVCMKGDVYYCHCHKTARLVAEELGWEFGGISKGKAPALLLTFQSRFGREEWLQPYTDKTLEELARRGIRRVAVVCPGFAADCVETLEEIAIGAKETFLEAGGMHFAVVPCLNDSAGGMEVVEMLCK